ncbi:MAG: lipopolysaccharide transport periplasmic protein LptA [Nitrospirae bacterium]|nr:lipopolysaccharide transport periplasmic protein LptA [Nitrospirota bacterium]
MKAQSLAAMAIRAVAAVALVILMSYPAIGALAAATATTKAPAAGGPSFKKSMKGDKDQPLIVTSATLTADNKKRTATFNGSVKAVKGDITFYANTMVVFYTEDKDQQIDRIEAVGNIKLIQGDKIITSEKATYFGANERVVFTGRPEAKEGKNIVTGTKIEYFFETEVSFVENSRVHLEEK